MLKKILSILVIFSFFSLFCTNIYAEEYEDMSEWKFTVVESNDKYSVCKYYSKIDSDKYAFCIEPDAIFSKKANYLKKQYEDDYVYKLVEAYDKYGKDLDASNETEKHNYFIATQILIWEYLKDEEITFTKDYSVYKQELLDYMVYMDMPLLMMANSEETIYESEVGEEVTIEEDYSNYDVITDEGVEVISNDENGLSYQITEEEPEYKYIELDPQYDPKDYAYTYYSTEGQDIYCFEGTYETPQPVFLSLMTLASPQSYVDIYYSKKDTDGNNIEGAEFTVYELNNDSPDTELTFIQTNNDINLYEALLADNSSYDNLSIELSERYETYLNGNIINTSEVGYFPYKIYNNDTLIKEGRCYVSDDINQTNGSYANIDVLSVFKGYSGTNDINTISSLETNKQYYLCESEPQKGYIYTHNACKLVDTSTYDGEVLEFVNGKRTYSLKLMKQSPYEVLLDGATFKITYLEDDEYKDIILTTGCLNIQREDNKIYLLYKYEDSNDVNVIEFYDDHYTCEAIEGKYYYYQSDNPVVNYDLFNNYAIVSKGGLFIDNLPYSSSLTIEELQAPEGFMITEPVYYLSPNIAYSEITFRNFRVNEFEILPKKKFKIPKTCINA